VKPHGVGRRAVSKQKYSTHTNYIWNPNSCKWERCDGVMCFHGCSSGQLYSTLSGKKKQTELYNVES
jgi:hypothetical protein